MLFSLYCLFFVLTTLTYYEAFMMTFFFLHNLQLGVLYFAVNENSLVLSRLVEMERLGDKSQAFYGLFALLTFLLERKAVLLKSTRKEALRERERSSIHVPSTKSSQ